MTVSSVNGKTGAVVLTPSDVGAAAAGQSPNLFNPDAPGVALDSYIASNGAVQALSGYTATDFFPVSAGQHYAVSFMRNVGWYRPDGSHISTVDNGWQSPSTVVQAPAGAAQARVTFPTRARTRMQVSAGAHFGDYQPFLQQGLVGDALRSAQVASELEALRPPSGLHRLRAVGPFRQDLTVVVVADSTANDDNDWVRLWLAQWAADLPVGVGITYRSWGTSPAGWRPEEVLRVGADATVTVWNGAIAGSTLAGHDPDSAKYAAPAGPGVLILSMGHNYNSEPAHLFAALLDEWLLRWHDQRPGCAVVAVSQNPRFSPATNIPAHRDRQAALREWAHRRRFDYVPVFEAFAAEPDGGQSLIHADGIHPSNPPAGQETNPTYGAVFWADRVLPETVA